MRDSRFNLESGVDLAHSEMNGSGTDDSVYGERPQVLRCELAHTSPDGYVHRG